MLAAFQNTDNTQHLWTLAGVMGIAFLAVLGVVLFLLRKFFQSRREEQKAEFATGASTSSGKSPSTPRTRSKH
jgi:predicted lipid-binding transport protein (Tim44 family)